MFFLKQESLYVKNNFRFHTIQHYSGRAHLPKLFGSVRRYSVNRTIGKTVSHRFGSVSTYPDHPLRHRTDIPDDLVLWDFFNSPKASVRADKIPPIVADHAPSQWMLNKVAIFVGNASHLTVDAVINHTPVTTHVGPVNYSETLEAKLDYAAQTSRTVAIPLRLHGNTEPFYPRVTHVLHSIRAWMTARRRLNDEAAQNIRKTFRSGPHNPLVDHEKNRGLKVILTVDTDLSWLFVRKEAMTILGKPMPEPKFTATKQKRHSNQTNRKLSRGIKIIVTGKEAIIKNSKKRKHDTKNKRFQRKSSSSFDSEPARVSD